MKFNVISPHSLTHHTVAWIEINTPAGNMVIQENHAPMIVEIESNSELLFMQPNGKQISMMIAQGFIHVQRGEVKLLITKET